MWKVLFKHLLLLFFCTVSYTAFSQITVIHFNAGFNALNDVEWFHKLADCKTESKTIDGNDNQKKYEIAVVPTIIVFDEGEEVKRFQADLSFKMVATRKEIQATIDEILMSDF